MHGRPRKAPAEADAVSSAAKSSKLLDLQSRLLHNHQNKLYDKDAVVASAKLLEINPEVYTAWNYRKLALQYNLEGVSDVEVVKYLVDEELRTVEIALRRNPKSYGAWHHRKWVLNLGLSKVDFDREFRLLDQLLKADARNFHGWNYYRCISKLKNVPEVEELKFTMDMINTNFSNYSAWHNRSAILSKLLKQKAEGFDAKENILTEEYDLVRQALFTDPSDQSGWFYHLWLLAQTVNLEHPQLISSWPSHGSNLVLSKYINLGILPIVLYFNQPVSGINSSTVAVNSVVTKNEDFIWNPLSITRSREAHCWVAYIDIQNTTKFGDSNSSTVDISITHPQDPHLLHLKFTVSIHTTCKERNEEIVDELVTWNDDHKVFDYESANNISFDKMIITEEHHAQVPKWNLETLSNEIDLFKELSDENCKFVKLTLARLLIAQDALASHENLIMQKKNHAEVLNLFDDLVKLDPSHARYYEDERSLAIMNQATFDKESITIHSLQSNEPAPISLRHAGLRFSRLSLTRIGFVERLLWVQMLDLSHNELRSIAGLEALQLLVCLNLSNNKISSLTSLEPLKLLRSLKILNIASNEIGWHPVDTTRYLCASPLSHANNVDAKIIEEFKKDNIEVGDNWEAILLFKELKLKQLDIFENAVVDEKLRKLLIKVVPTLKWLGGVRVR